MKETAMQVWERKVRNRKRKQAEKIQRKKEEIWKKLAHVEPPDPFANLEIVKQTINVKSRKLPDGMVFEVGDSKTVITNEAYKEIESILIQETVRKVKPNGCK